MDRIYIALRWLAAVALVAGLAGVAMLALRVDMQYTAEFGNTDLTGSQSGYVEIELLQIFSSLAVTFASGVTILGTVAAWADHRTGWLTALLIVALLAIVGPYVFDVWPFLEPMITPPSAATSAIWTAEVGTFTQYAVPLIPVPLILIFTYAVRRDDTGARLASDAALEITRGPL